MFAAMGTGRFSCRQSSRLGAHSHRAIDPRACEQALRSPYIGQFGATETFDLFWCKSRECFHAQFAVSDQLNGNHSVRFVTCCKDWALCQLTSVPILTVNVKVVRHEFVEDEPRLDRYVRGVRGVAGNGALRRSPIERSD